jgi:UDP-N-acetyl-D-glucosamine/UDP-N-acetyl-D-galactosamine dehydrogenase
MNDGNLHNQYSVCIVGLGYVGLPLAIEFGKKYKVVGFDIDESRIKELENKTDRTREVSHEELMSSSVHFSSDLNDIKNSNVYVVTVPTPVDRFKAPDLSHLKNASAMLGKVLKKNDIVIYESTVYPGCTEEECIPVLIQSSGLVYNKDFFCGYSPERINPGDKINTLTTIKKVTSGSTPEIAEIIDTLYKSIITAGTHKAPSIKVAEASKAIENAQRDVNISFINELALIFDRMGIDTTDVIEAAATKWNFLKYKPGLVGGHCIGVDPYYLAHKAEALGYQPQVILSGRRVNDMMGTFVANKVLKLLIEKGHAIKGANVLILGITFKENCSDVRNTKVIDIYNELAQFGINVDVYDPWASAEEVKREYNIDLINNMNDKIYHAVVIATAHDEFLKIDFKKIKDDNVIIFDTKSLIDRKLVDSRL